MISIAPHISWNNVAGELALYDTRDGTYHALNTSAAAIWRAIAANGDPDSVVAVIAADHNLPRDRAEAEVREFVASARAIGLLSAAR